MRKFRPTGVRCSCSVLAGKRPLRRKPARSDSAAKSLEQMASGSPRWRIPGRARRHRDEPDRTSITFKGAAVLTEKEITRQSKKRSTGLIIPRDTFTRSYSSRNGRISPSDVCKLLSPSHQDEAQPSSAWEIQEETLAQLRLDGSSISPGG